MRVVILSAFMVAVLVFSWGVTIALMAYFKQKPDPDLVRMSDDIEQAGRAEREAHVKWVWDQVQESDQSPEGDKP